MRMTEEQIFEKVSRGELTTDEAMKLLEQQKKAIYSKIFHYNENLLKDHRIYGTQVLMGMVHCSLAVEAANHYFPGKKLRAINNMTFLDAIKVKEGQRAEVFVDIEESGESVSFKNRYSIDSSGDFTATASGSFSFGQLPAKGESLNINALLEQADRVVDPSSFYEGHDLYGPTFYTLKKAYYRSDGVIGRFELTAEARSELSQYEVHPTFFDAAGVNSLFAVTPEKLGNDFWVPIFIKNIRIYSQLPEQFYCYTKIANKNSELIITNTAYYSASGEFLMSVDGLNIKRVPSMAAFGIEEPVTAKSQATPAGGDIKVEVKNYLIKKMAALLNRPEREIAADKNFMDLGVESSSLIELSKTIESELDVELYPTLFFEYQNINELTEYFTDEHGECFGSTDAASPTPPVEKNEPVQQTTAQGDLKGTVISYLTKKVKGLPGLGSAAIDINKNFMDLGIDSTSLIDMSKTIEDDLDVELYPTLFFEYQNIAELAEYFIDEHSESFASMTAQTPIAPQASKAKPVPPIVNRAEVIGETVPPLRPQQETPGVPAAQAFSQDIAIIGMAGKVAGADNMDQFWEILEASKDMIREVPENRWDYHSWFDENRDASNKTYSKWGSFINDVDKFDPLFFGMAPKEAVWTDPQLRILLEVIYNTIEDAGYGKRIRGTNTGIYVGVCFKEYWDEVLRAHTPMNDYEHSSSSLSSLTGRVSYTFDLQGPAIPLDNACASSLTALHLACNSLRAGETDMAFVAGTNLLLSPMHHVYFSRIQALSPRGHCYSFDEKGDGYVPGEGVLAMLLKPLDKAIADGDNIHALIKGSAINHVGRSNNPTAPRPELQTKLLLKAWESAGINPETISYLEAHGTGTPLGDPIEVNALKKAFKKHTTKKDFCHLGSTKAHLGHLEAAAGLAGVMKVIMSMKNGKIPKMPNYEKTNPYVQLDGSPLKINRELTEWTTQPGVPKRAGISSFGMTGNNSHVVIEEYSAPQSGASSGLDELFVLSARDEDRLKEYAQRFIDFLTEKKDRVNFADMIYSLQMGREEMGQRLAIVANGHDSLLSGLKSYVEGKSEAQNIITGNIKDSDSSITDNLLTGEEGDEFLKVIIRNRNVAKVGYLWIMGVKVDWSLLHLNRRGSLISLPTYPFERKRYWKPEKVIESRDNIFCLPKWIAYQSKESSYESSGKKVLLIYPPEAMDLKSSLSKLHNKDDIYEVLLVNTTRKINDRLWELDAFDKNSFDDILNSITEIDRIYFLGGIEKRESETDQLSHFNMLQERGLFTLLRLVQKLNRRGFAEKKLTLKVVTNELYRVTGDELLKPFSGSLVGLVKSIKKEFDNWNVSSFDIKLDEQENYLSSTLQNILTKEAKIIALRKGKPYTQVIYKKSLPEKVPFKKDGVYLVAGGLGGIGYRLCSYLAKDAKAKLIITGRTPLNRRKKTRVKELEQMGGQVLYLQADMTDLESMQKAVKEGKEKFGSINGVIHSAAVVKNNLIVNIDEEELRESLAPSLVGSLILFESLKEEKLDFLLLFSSGASFYCDYGSAGYVAGNNFKDCLTYYLNSKTDYPVKIINWGYWQGIGLGDDKALDERFKAQGIEPMEPAKGIKAIENVLNMPGCQALVIRAKDEYLKKMNLVDENELSFADDSFTAKVNSEKTFVAHKEETISLKNRIITIIGDILEVEQSSLDEDLAFSDFGVDSIISVKIINRINSELATELRTTDLFNFSTINLLYNHINQIVPVNELATSPRIESSQVTSDNLEKRIITVISDILEISPSELDSTLPFTNLGVDSIMSVKIINRLNSELSLNLKTTDLFNYTTIEGLTEYCQTLQPQQATTVAVMEDQVEPEELNDKKMMALLKDLEKGKLEIEQIENMLGDGNE